MRVKTQTLTIALCFAIISIQISCKKDDAAIQQSAQVNSSNAVTDSTTDSSLLKGMVAWYTFNGDTKDHSGNHNDVISNSAFPAAGKSGLAKTAYRFDGTSSYMQVANSSSINPLK